ncbi:MAG: hypothetical protein ABUK01_02775 [Leptospirales bacterium]
MSRAVQFNKILIILILNLIITTFVYSEETKETKETKEIKEYKEKKFVVFIGFGTMLIPEMQSYIWGGQLNIFLGNRFHFNIKEFHTRSTKVGPGTELGFRYTLWSLDQKLNVDRHSGIYIGPVFSKNEYFSRIKPKGILDETAIGVGIETGLLGIFKAGLSFGLRLSYQYKFIDKKFTNYIKTYGETIKKTSTTYNEFSMFFDIGWAF